MTIAEFIHPLRGGPRAELIQAVLYYLKHREGQSEVTASDVKAALMRGRVPWARTANIPRDLAKSVPYVDQGVPRGPWAITSSGERNVRALLEPTAAGADVEADAADLRRLAAKVADDAVGDYVEESVKCLEVGARRAAVVFLWTGAVSAIRNEVWQHGAWAIEAALRSHNPKAKFAKKHDFEGVKDKDLLQVAQDLAVYDKSEKKRLGEALDLRNDCGHPVKYKPGEKKVSSFIEDVVGIVFA